MCLSLARTLDDIQARVVIGESLGSAPRRASGRVGEDCRRVELGGDTGVQVMWSLEGAANDGVLREVIDIVARGGLGRLGGGEHEVIVDEARGAFRLQLFDGEVDAWGRGLSRGHWRSSCHGGLGLSGGLLNGLIEFAVCRGRLRGAVALHVPEITLQVQQCVPDLEGVVGVLVLCLCSFGNLLGVDAQILHAGLCMSGSGNTGGEEGNITLRVSSSSELMFSSFIAALSGETISLFTS